MKILLGLLLISFVSCNKNSKPTSEYLRKDAEVPLKVLADHCELSQCYQVIELDGKRCIAQYKGGLYCYDKEKK